LLWSHHSTLFLLWLVIDTMKKAYTHADVVTITATGKTATAILQLVYKLLRILLVVLVYK